MATLTAAHHQWANRPDDQRFQTIAALSEYVGRRSDESRTGQPVPRHRMRVEADDAGALSLAGCAFTNWSFGQLASLAGAPAGYLTTLPAPLAADCINSGLAKTDPALSGVPYVRFPALGTDYPGPASDTPANRPILRAITGEGYERILDRDLVAGLARAEARGWTIPPDWQGRPSGLYASDRDMFAFMIDDANRSIVHNPGGRVTNDEFGRGFFLWNSEEGASSFGASLFLFRFVCGNLLVWGARPVYELRFRHVGDIRHRITTATAKIMSEAARDISDDLDGLRLAQSEHLIPMLPAHSEQQTLAELIPAIVERSKVKVGPALAKAAILKAWAEDEDPRTVFGAVQGMTAYARDLPHAGERARVQRLAGSLMPTPRGGR